MNLKNLRKSAFHQRHLRSILSPLSKLNWYEGL